MIESGLMYTVSIVVLFGLYMAGNNGQYGVSNAVRLFFLSSLFLPSSVFFVSKSELITASISSITQVVQIIVSSNRTYVTATLFRNSTMLPYLSCDRE
jgi:hypothetical protein